jgi:hypothetical protein
MESELLEKYGARYWMDLLDRFVAKLLREPDFLPYLSGLSDEHLLAMKLSLLELLIEGHQLDNASLIRDIHRSFALNESVFGEFVQMLQNTLVQGEVPWEDIQAIVDRARSYSSLVIND